MLQLQPSFVERMGWGGRDRGRDRETEKQTERQRDKDRQTERGYTVLLLFRWGN